MILMSWLNDCCCSTTAPSSDPRWTAVSDVGQAARDTAVVLIDLAIADGS